MRYKKGDPGGPGRKRIVEMLGGEKRLTRYEFEKIALRYIRMPRNELKKHANDHKTPALDLMVISLIVKTIEKGDPIRLEYILSRLLGKIKVVVQEERQETDESEKVVFLLPRSGREPKE